MKMNKWLIEMGPPQFRLAQALFYVAFAYGLGGWRFSSFSSFFPLVVLTLVCAQFGSMYAKGLNNYLDKDLDLSLPKDELMREGKPYAAGLMSRREMGAYVRLTLVACVATGVLVSINLVWAQRAMDAVAYLAVMGAAIFIGTLYSIGKRRLWAGFIPCITFTICLNWAFQFMLVYIILRGFNSPNIPQVLMASFWLWLINMMPAFALKDIVKIDVDQGKVDTFPLKFGVNATVNVTYGFLAAMVLVGVLCVLLKIVHPIFLLPLALGTLYYIVFLNRFKRMLKNRNYQDLRTQREKFMYAVAFAFLIPSFGFLLML